MQLFVLSSLGVHILKYGEAVGGIAIFELPPPLEAAVAGLDETLINQIGAGFFAAAFFWIAVTFKPDDWKALSGTSSGYFPEDPITKMLQGGDNAVTKPDFG